MKNKTRFRKISIVAGLLALAGSVLAQGDKIQIEGRANRLGDMPPIWISMSGFSGETDEVLKFDLYVQGFNFTNTDGAQYILTGSNNGNLQGRVTDKFNKGTLVSKAYTGGSMRRQAHTFADDFVEALGRKPIGKTKIAFKADSGSTSEILVADFDGFNSQAVTRDGSIVAAPAWVPKQFALYYTSYKLGNPNIFFHDLSSGQRQLFSHFSGLNTAAAVSPDGRRVAMILSKGGSPDVYVINADGSGLKRLTVTREDESSPCWTADGESIVFATKVNERRALCKVPAAGGQVQRISTVGASNPTEPDCSPDGKWIAFTRQTRDFEICVVPAGGGEATILVSGADPSWAPNSRTLVFTREQNHRRYLSLLDVPTKQVKDISRISGSNSQPSWAR
jgi:TolB protein